MSLRASIRIPAGERTAIPVSEQPLAPAQVPEPAVLAQAQAAPAARLAKFFVADIARVEPLFAHAKGGSKLHSQLCLLISPIHKSKLCALEPLRLALSGDSLRRLSEKL